MALQAMNAVAPKGSFNRELWVFYAQGLRIKWPLRAH
jgi:hypothetical protein